MNPEDRGDAGDAAFSRRDLLCSGVGVAAAAGLSGRGGPGLQDRVDAPPEATAREVTDYALSVRATAEWMDREHHPRRLRGNGPPFAPDRFGEDGKRRASTMEKAEYEGKQTIFNPRTFAEVSYDMGMMNRNGGDGSFSQDEGEMSGAVPPLTEKGLVECHRWAEEGEDWRSLRNTLERHERGERVRCLWLNATLLIAPIHGYKNFDARAEELGRLIGGSGYDVAAFCEVFKEEHASKLIRNYERSGQTKLNATHDQGTRLLTIVGHDGSKGTDWSVRSESEPNYTAQATWGFERGYHRHTVDLTSGPDVEGIEVFSTHLETNGTREKFRAKTHQLSELARAVEDRQGPDHGHVPKIVVGDFNIKSNQDYSDDYNTVDMFDLDDTVYELDRFGDLQDAWTTHGGPMGDTIGSDIPRSRKSGPYPGGGGTAPETCHCEEFEHDSYRTTKINGKEKDANRLDYVFVEKPKPEHDVTIDVARMWRVPFSLDCPGVGGGPYKDGADRLIDHVGIGFELLVTPRSG